MGRTTKSIRNHLAWGRVHPTCFQDVVNDSLHSARTGTACIRKGPKPIVNVPMSTEFSARLAAARGGDPDALSEAFEGTYNELRRLAHRQLRSLRPGDTLVTTALVNEAFLKLVRHPVEWADRNHFAALAARAMRQILIDYARERRSLKRGGGRRRTTLDGAAIPVESIAEEMLAID